MEVTLMTSPKLHIVPTLRELTSLSFNINSCTKVHSSEVDLVTGGPAYMLSPSLPLGESYLDYGGTGCNKTSQMARIGWTDTIQQFASIVIDLTSKRDRDALLNLKIVKLFNFNCTVTPYENRIQVYQCNKCGMFSHASNSCTTPCCLLCGSKDHQTDEHPDDLPQWCVNCKGNHTSSHKECNTQCIRLGLKPIPHKNETAHKKNQPGTKKDQPPRTSQKRKEKGKGKESEHMCDNDPVTENIGLLSADITSLLTNNPTWSEQHEHTAKLIHNQAREKLTIKLPAHGKPNNSLLARTKSEMDVDDNHPLPSQWIDNLNERWL